MPESNEMICVTRYCPRCGSEIFCRTDSPRHTVFYISEDMKDPTNVCPQCQFDLFTLPPEALLAEPDRAKPERLLPHRIQAGKNLTEAVFKRDPERFGSKAAAKRAVTAVAAAVFEFLSRGQDVRLPGLGSFNVRERKARKGRNPQTGEELQIPARKAVRFSPTKALREKLRG